MSYDFFDEVKNYVDKKDRLMQPFGFPKTFLFGVSSPKALELTCCEIKEKSHMDKKLLWEKSRRNEFLQRKEITSGVLHGSVSYMCSSPYQRMI